MMRDNRIGDPLDDQACRKWCVGRVETTIEKATPSGGVIDRAFAGRIFWVSDGILEILLESGRVFA